MAVTREDVKHVAALARLSVTDERAEQLTAQLNTILAHMDALARVDTTGLEPLAGVGAASAPLREDAGPSIELESPIEAFAPSVRDGFFLVPRLSSHESVDEG